MKFKTFLAVILLAFVLSLPVFASSLRIGSAYPVLSIANNVASCQGDIYAEGEDDWVSATMELWKGNTRLNYWNASGTYHVSMAETESVTRYHTYRLVIHYTVNGVAKPSVEDSQYYG